jgi:hypothetical protein
MRSTTSKAGLYKIAVLPPWRAIRALPDPESVHENHGGGNGENSVHIAETAFDQVAYR